jgi:hypothetical protein
MLQQSFALVCAVSLLAGCITTAPSGQSAAPAAAPPPRTAGPNVQLVKSMDGSYEGEIIGKIAPGSKFSKVKIGMTIEQVTQQIGAYQRFERTATGKSWIPYYFGNDAYRWQVSYMGEGCLTFTGGNVFGGSGNQLIMITVEKQGCI